MTHCIHCKKKKGLKARNPIACSPCILRWHRIEKEARRNQFPLGGPWKNDNRFRWPTQGQFRISFEIEFGEEI